VEINVALLLGKKVHRKVCPQFENVELILRKQLGKN